MRKLRHANWAPGWSVVEEVGSKSGRLIEIAYSPSAEKPYCVQFGGNGHYFKTLTEARAYCHGRGWVAYSYVYGEG